MEKDLDTDISDTDLDIENVSRVKLDDRYRHRYCHETQGLSATIYSSIAPFSRP